MKKWLVLLLLLLALSTAALAGIFIYEPKDKTTTFDKVVMLKGIGKDLKIIKINDQAIPVNSKGAFACGLVLRPGKNLVEIRALDLYGDHFVKSLSLLGMRTFPDVESPYEGKKHWARNQIVYLASLGFIEGYPDDNFYPGNPVTRGELATWIARTKQLSVPALTEDVFFDVPKEHWRAPYVKAVVDAGYMKGYDNQTFGLDDPISRRKAAEVVVATEGIDVVERVKPLFIDVPKAERGAFPIYLAKEKGLLKGVSENLPVYEPDRALTRAEAAVLLARFDRSQNAVQWLFNFDKGFTSAAYSAVNLEPKIISFTINPVTIIARQKSTVRLQAQLDPRQNLSPISKVSVNLTELGGMPDVQLFDDGSHGDLEKDDQIYTLNLSFEPKESGSKMLYVIAVDRLGWQGGGEASLTIVE
ncbi:MAG: S-layer homology domain-containing protein [Candidatus Margulisiibacteriota bacterium]